MQISYSLTAYKVLQAGLYWLRTKKLSPYELYLLLILFWTCIEITCTAIVIEAKSIDWDFIVEGKIRIVATLVSYDILYYIRYAPNKCCYLEPQTPQHISLWFG